jgi:DNA repair protein RadC
MAEEKQHYHGHRKRIKERFIKSLKSNKSDSIPDYEVLEMILFSAYPRQDTKPIAKELIEKFGSLSAIFSADVERLEKEGNLSEKVLYLH